MTSDGGNLGARSGLQTCGMLSCRQAQELFFDHLDKELSVEEAALVQEHLNSCTPCTDSFNSTQEFIDCVKRKLRTAQLPDGLARRVSSALDSLES